MCKYCYNVFNIDHRCQCYETSVGKIYTAIGILPKDFISGYANSDVHYAKTFNDTEHRSKGYTAFALSLFKRPINLECVCLTTLDILV